MKKLLLFVVLGCVAGFMSAPEAHAVDKSEVEELFPNPADQIGIRKVAGIVSEGGIGMVIIQWNATLVSDAQLKARVSKLCAKQPKRDGAIEVVEGFNNATAKNTDGLTIPTRSGMIECLKSN